MTDVIERLKQQYQGKRMLVVGLGLQGGGVGVAKFFSELGAKVTVTDKKNKEQLTSSIEQLTNWPIVYRLGEHRLEDFLNADVIFKGPSVRWDMPEIVAATQKGIPIEMELSFFAAHCPAKIIGITGTRGKSTTTQMIYTLLKTNNYPVYLGGGLPDISTINYLHNLTDKDWIVMELSSWALSGFHRRKVSPHIAVFTNFYPDHLNYYKNMDDYLYDKKAIYLYQKQGDYLVINNCLQGYIDSATHFLSHESLSLPAKGGRAPLESEKNAVASSIIYFSKNEFPGALQYLKGDHNKENAAATLKVADILRLHHDRSVVVIKQFKGLPFRQEIVGQKNNVIFINDTTSTTPVATIKAIEAFSDKPIYLILGGTSKHLPYKELIKYLIKVKRIILLKGGFTDEILPSLKVQFADKITIVYDDMGEAITTAYNLADSDKEIVYILFSPSAPSFAMFNNEFHRGREFNRIVNKIVENS